MGLIHSITNFTKSSRPVGVQQFNHLTIKLFRIFLLNTQFLQSLLLHNCWTDSLWCRLNGTVLTCETAWSLAHQVLPGIPIGHPSSDRCCNSAIAGLMRSIWSFIGAGFARKCAPTWSLVHWALSSIHVGHPNSCSCNYSTPAGPICSVSRSMLLPWPVDVLWHRAHSSLPNIPVQHSNDYVCCNSTTAGLFDSISSSIEPSWNIDMQQHGHLHVKAFLSGAQILANSIIIQPLIRFALSPVFLEQYLPVNMQLHDHWSIAASHACGL